LASFISAASFEAAVGIAEKKKRQAGLPQPDIAIQETGQEVSIWPCSKLTYLNSCSVDTWYAKPNDLEF